MACCLVEPTAKGGVDAHQRVPGRRKSDNANGWRFIGSLPLLIHHWSNALRSNTCGLLLATNTGSACGSFMSCAMVRGVSNICSDMRLSSVGSRELGSP